MVLVLVYILFTSIFYRKWDAKITFVTTGSLFLLSSSLHIAEIFRIATASSVGLIALYAWLDHKKLANKFYRIVSIWLSITFIFANRGNYYLPGIDDITEGRPVPIPEFNGQLWKPEISNFYLRIKSTLDLINQSNCDIKYSLNDSGDTFLLHVNPFPLLQPGPFKTDEKFNTKFRPDLNYLDYIKSTSKIVILRMAASDRHDLVIEDGFKIFDYFNAPPVYHNSIKQTLYILTPNKCKQLKIEN
jgi:hypothetical protein